MTESGWEEEVEVAGRWRHSRVARGGLTGEAERWPMGRARRTHARRRVLTRPPRALVHLSAPGLPDRVCAQVPSRLGRFEVLVHHHVDQTRCEGSGKFLDKNCCSILSENYKEIRAETWWLRFRLAVNRARKISAQMDQEKMHFLHKVPFLSRRENIFLSQNSSHDYEIF